MITLKKHEKLKGKPCIKLDDEYAFYLYDKEVLSHAMSLKSNHWNHNTRIDIVNRNGYSHIELYPDHGFTIVIEFPERVSMSYNFNIIRSDIESIIKQDMKVKISLIFAFEERHNSPPDLTREIVSYFCKYKGVT